MLRKFSIFGCPIFEETIKTLTDYIPFRLHLLYHTLGSASSGHCIDTTESSGQHGTQWYDRGEGFAYGPYHIGSPVSTTESDYRGDGCPSGECVRPGERSFGPTRARCPDVLIYSPAVNPLLTPLTPPSGGLLPSVLSSQSLSLTEPRLASPKFFEGDFDLFRGFITQCEVIFFSSV